MVRPDGAGPLVSAGVGRGTDSAVAFAVSVPAFLLIGPWAFALWLVLPVALHRISQRTGITARP